MEVIATAGHVDHGKSTLVRALTGIEPDRWARERERGMTIDLGFAWTTLASGRRVAFVDVPGHVRFVSNMLAGVGPVPAVMFVIAADQGWQAQSQEHWEAVEALGVRHGLLAVTRSDLFDPEMALEEARGAMGLDWPAVTVSGATGEGLDRLRAGLDELAASLPAPDPDAPVRLWIDRAFTIKGAGTVVTGTLPAGALRNGDELELQGERVRVRGLQALGEPADTVAATARVAVNLRGVDRDRVHRGMTLLTPDAWLSTGVVDVRLSPPPGRMGWPREAMFHIGSAAAAVRIRPLGDDTARLALATPLPLRVGDRGLLRCSGRPIIGVLMLDVRPARLRRRGAAARRAAQLAEDGIPDAARLLRWNRLITIGELTAMGAGPAGLNVPRAGEWLVDPDTWTALADRLRGLVAAQPGITVGAARGALGVPGRALVEALAREIGAPLADGRIGGQELSPAVAAAVKELERELSGRPYQAPDAGRLAELGLTGRALGAAIRAGVLLRVADGVILLPGADERAAQVLARLPQPFTAADARKALDTTRRVVIPLLEHLDDRGYTKRIDDRLRTTTTCGQTR